MGTLPNREEKLSLDTFIRGLWEENPVFVMLLGMCPVLAVTNSTMNAIAMGVATTFVLVASSTLISLLRSWIPKQVRIASYIVIIATFVTVVDYAIQAISLDLYNALGAFIQLIVANCVILGRAEAYASKQRLHTTLDQQSWYGGRVYARAAVSGYGARGPGQRHPARDSDHAGELRALGGDDTSARGLFCPGCLAAVVCLAETTPRAPPA